VSHSDTEYDPPRSSALLSVDDVGEFLGISRSGVYRLVRSGDMPCYRVGERLRFRQDEINAYLDRSRSE
jgi:excisionase family DNA binding protein